MPITKAANEPNRHLTRLKSQFSSNVITTAVRVEDVGIHPVRVYQDFLLGNTAFYQLLPQRIRDNCDQGCRCQGNLLANSEPGQKLGWIPVLRDPDL